METQFAEFFVWNADPVMIRFAGRSLRWYSFFYFLVFVCGYVLWHWQMRRGGHGAVPTSRLLLWMLVGLLTGARLGHCLFYEPEFYLAHPLEILNLSRGGVSSHGGTIAIFLTLFLYARRYEYSYPELGDRISFAVMFSAALVRFGNFFNSEIVGREWYGPLAIRFPRFTAKLQNDWENVHGPLGWTAQALPRHPVQLYEAFGIWLVLLVLLLVDRRLGEDRPRGLLAGLFCGLYFVVRFVVEYAKEYLRFHDFVPDAAQQVIRVVPTAGLTMGQWLSLPFIAIGAGVIVWSTLR